MTQTALLAVIKFSLSPSLQGDMTTFYVLDSWFTFIIGCSTPQSHHQIYNIFVLVFSKKTFGGMDLDFWPHNSLDVCCKNSHKIEDNLYVQFIKKIIYAESTIKAKMLNFTVAFLKITMPVNVKALSAKENLNHQPVAKTFRFPSGILNTLHILRMFVGNVSYFSLLFHVYKKWNLLPLFFPEDEWNLS